MFIGDFFLGFFNRLGDWFNPIIIWFGTLWRNTFGKFVLIFGFLWGLIKLSVRLYSEIYSTITNYMSDDLNPENVNFAIVDSMSLYLGYINAIFPVEELIYYCVMLLNLLFICIFIKLNLKIKRMIF